MDFDEITRLVVNNRDLPEKSTLTDRYAYHTLQALMFRFRKGNISKEYAAKEKQELIRKYEKQKREDEWREKQMSRQLGNIRLSEQLRIQLNLASREGQMSKQLWLDAVERIGRMCGCLSGWESCKKYLEGVEYEEQEHLSL